VLIDATLPPSVPVAAARLTPGTDQTVPRLPLH
jgi:hypothetical protein